MASRDGRAEAGLCGQVPPQDLGHAALGLVVLLSQQHEVVEQLLLRLHHHHNHKDDDDTTGGQERESPACLRCSRRWLQ